MLPYYPLFHTELE